MTKLLKQAKKALAQKEKAVEKYSKELSKLPSDIETGEILLYLTGIYIRKNRVNYQLEEAVVSGDERIIFEDLFGDVFL